MYYWLRAVITQIRRRRQGRPRRFLAVLVIAAVSLVAAAFVALLWRGAPWLDASRLQGLSAVQKETAVDAIRGRLLQLGAGLVVAVGLVYTALTFRLNRAGNVTDRYTKAIEQLGSPLLDVRLGAIYALERIMIDSRRDHPTIVEVLAAYVRERTPLEDKTAADGQAEQAPTDSARRIATDVQAALTVLGRRPPGRAERGSLNLQRTRLTCANLTNADLLDADLTGANLADANLKRANLTWAKLIGADLSRADLTLATLTYADLTDANLGHAHLTLASLLSATLRQANLADAELLDADLTQADLERTKLCRAYLNGANLTRANLKETDLAHADLHGAHLDHAHLNRADLTGTDLTGVDLTKSDLDNADLTHAKVDGAKLPAGFAGSARMEADANAPSKSITN